MNLISIWTNIKNNLISVLIPKGIQIPCKISNTYVTSYDNQTELIFDFY